MANLKGTHSAAILMLLPFKRTRYFAQVAALFSQP